MSEYLRYNGIVLMKCQSCQERTHCRQCGNELSETLNMRSDICLANLDMENKVLSFSLNDGANEDLVLDALEELGLFV